MVDPCSIEVLLIIHHGQGVFYYSKTMEWAPPMVILKNQAQTVTQRPPEIKPRTCTEGNGM